MIKTFYTCDLDDSDKDINEFDKKVNEYLEQLKKKGIKYQILVSTAGTEHFVHHVVTVVSEQ